MSEEVRLKRGGKEALVTSNITLHVSYSTALQHTDNGWSHCKCQVMHTSVD